MIRTTLAILTLALTTAALAQTPTTQIPPPTAGLLTSYVYWPTQFVEFVGDELPYSMLEVGVDNTGKTPLIEVTLTARPSGKRIHYANSDALVAAAKYAGGEAYKVAMAFEWDGTQVVGSAATVRFSMADEKPFEFRFVQGSDMSEQGSGMTPLPELPMPVLAYRELGAVAGEGTAMIIGGVAAPAPVWKEISKPPYFVVYRGALAVAAHRIELYPGSEKWTVASAPAALTAGSAWVLEGERGAHRTIQIDKVDGAHFTFSVNDARNPAVRVTLQATQAAGAWTVESARYAPVKDGDKHSLTLNLTPASLDFVVGKKTKIASATLTTAGTPEDRTTTVAMKSPDWTKGKNLTEQTTWQSGTMTLTAK